jgi:hydroxymethylglutaryl-CoA synthase
MGVGIVSYGTYIPRLRIKSEEYVKVWNAASGGFKEKSVMDFDEDVITMGAAAGKEALALVAREEVGVLSVASTNYPYAEKMLSSTMAAMLGLKNQVNSTEHGNSTRAGSEALLTALALVKADGLAKGLTVAADAPRAEVKGALEHPLSAAATAFVFGHQDVIAEVETYTAYVEEYLGDRYRIAGDVNIKDIGVPAYGTQAFEVVVTRAVQNLLAITSRKPQDYHYLVIDQKSLKGPMGLATKLGFTSEQLHPGYLFAQVGDTGVCSALLGLAAVLDQAQPGERIMVVSYGSGSGSHAISITVTGSVSENRKAATVADKLAKKEYIDYIRYLKVRRQIV